MAISQEQWENIVKFFGGSTHVTSSPVIPYCAFSTVDEDGSPRVAPYTSLVLGEHAQGFYFDELSHRTTANLERDPKICVLIVKRDKWFWIKAVLSGKYQHPPAIRLLGRAGQRREATEQEIKAYTHPVKSLKMFKGYQPMWGFMKHGRDIYFDDFETVKCGPIPEQELI
jgi:hypothetical protein